eukprot:5540486-Prymnesium_polylepis.1
MSEDEAAVRRAQLEAARLQPLLHDGAPLDNHVLEILIVTSLRLSRSLTESDLGNSLMVSVAAGLQKFSLMSKKSTSPCAPVQ